MTKFESAYEDFQKALARFEEILREDKNDIVRDSAIKRYELVFDLAWKTAKAFLEEYHNTPCASPRSCFREAFRLELIDYDEFWIEMSSIRNYTVHAYSEVLAEKIFKDLPRALAVFQKLAKGIEKARQEKIQ